MGDGPPATGVVEQLAEEPPYRRWRDFTEPAAEVGEVRVGDRRQPRVPDVHQAETLKRRRPALVGGDLGQHVPLAHLEHEPSGVGARRLPVEPLSEPSAVHVVHQAGQ